MLRLKIFPFLFLIVFSPVLNAAGANPLLDSGSTVYAKGEYTKAAKFYETILAGGQ